MRGWLRDARLLCCLVLRTRQNCDGPPWKLLLLRGVYYQQKPQYLRTNLHRRPQIMVTLVDKSLTYHVKQI